MGKILKDGNYHLDYTPGSAVSAGDVVVLESLLAGMAMLDIPSGGKGTLLVQGIVEVDKDASALGQGEKVYYDGSQATGIWHTLDFDAGETEIEEGQEITGGTSGATATVVSVSVASGTWAGDNAAGTLVLKCTNGTFQNDEDLEVSEATVAVADGTAAETSSTNDLLGVAAAAAASADSTVQVMLNVATS